ncbi:hypothetical protein EUTSA_v10008909mg [Eutrema salsugineum]|uniref:RING-type domain-containing protein n=1 Tax=Eutrema salsugineum TaxID=72664 RepID=V4KYC6_EUTSA|nr:hypothetical protein EUTSA_v10008909mg [Eutrema salsugineum]ESQ36375.1 hypothetical protein EUTSA_v10008909mg [Eutrema salsugineum]
MDPLCRRCRWRLSREEYSYFELIVAGTYSLICTGFLSVSFLYAGWYPVKDPDPDRIIFPWPVYLFTGLLFGFFTLRIAELLYIDVCKKLRRLRRFLGKQEEEELEEDEEEEEEEERCPICLEYMERCYVCVVGLPYCMHRFHRYCIDKWLFRRSCCPTCRSFASPSSTHLEAWS